MISLQEEINKHIENVQDFPKQGIQYKDISPIFLNSELCGKIVRSLADFSRGKVDVVCGIESRGFLLGTQIARELDIPFVIVRKAGKLPPPVISQSYSLEYGTAEIEVKKGHIRPGQKVLIHDDVLATGGTAAACAKLVINCGAKAEQFSFLAMLSFLEGRTELRKYSSEVYSLVEY